VEALTVALGFESPADAVLRRFFADHRSLGARDRSAVAETVFDVLRNRRLYAHLAQSGTGPLADRLVAISRSRERIDASALPSEVRYSLPDWLWGRLAGRMPVPELEALAIAMLAPAGLDLRVNPMKADREAAIDALRAHGIECEASPLAPLGIRVAGKPALEKTAPFRDGVVEVQDCGSQLIAHLVAPRRGQTVVDFCAGAGGKTLALAASMRGTGQVFACDVSTARLQRLRPRLARSGASNVQPFGIDSEADPKLERLAGRADAVLVDAPCSGTGTLRRNPDLKWRVGESDVAELAVKQRAILVAAARLVCPGGALVYATCSLLDEENDEIRRWFEATNPGWRVDPARAGLERQGARIDPLLDQDCLRLRPDTHGTDAFYAVRWLRPA
jgi:16S rRNA (cytosine967-C5)-methyltransferase